VNLHWNYQIPRCPTRLRCLGFGRIIIARCWITYIRFWMGYGSG